MSNYIGVFVLILILTYVNSQNATQEYTIHRDFFNGFKAAEFSVFDTSEKNIHYRIESNYGVTHNVKVIAYPSKQEVGRLQAKITVVLYNADISILNPQTNQWNNGLVEQNFKLLASSFNVNWNGHRITLATEAFESTIISTISNETFCAFQSEILYESILEQISRANLFISVGCS
jgi:hypothetical protein